MYGNEKDNKMPPDDKDGVIIIIIITIILWKINEHTGFNIKDNT